jgi:membrane protein YqaA with SNARE-associated domain
MGVQKSIPDELTWLLNINFSLLEFAMDHQVSILIHATISFIGAITAYWIGYIVGKSK